MRWMGLLAVVASLALAAAGCGGSDGGNAAATGETTTTEETVTEETTGETTTDTDVSGTGLTEDCQKLAELSTAFGEAGASSGGSSGDLDAAAEAFSAFAAQAPEEIRDDYRTIAEAYTKFAAATKGIDLSSGQTPSAADVAKITQAAQALSTSDVTAASAHISAWTVENCTNP